MGKIKRKTFRTRQGVDKVYPDVLAENVHFADGQSLEKKVYDAAHEQAETAQPESGMQPNVLYRLGVLSGNTAFTFDANSLDDAVVNHWYWTFDTPATAPDITWPSQITNWVGGAAPAIKADRHYEVSVLDGYATYLEVEL